MALIYWFILSLRCSSPESTFAVLRGAGRHWFEGARLAQGGALGEGCMSKNQNPQDPSAQL